MLKIYWRTGNCMWNVNKVNTKANQPIRLFTFYGIG